MLPTTSQFRFPRCSPRFVARTRIPRRPDHLRRTRHVVLKAVCLALPVVVTLQAEVVSDADLGSLAAGELRSVHMGVAQPQGTLQVNLADVEGPHYLLVQGFASGKDRAQSDLGLYFAERSLDYDLEGDYNREGLLLHGGRDYSLRIFQLNQTPVPMRLELSLQPVEAQTLVPGRAIPGLLNDANASAFYRIDHKAGEDLQIDVRSADSNLMLMLALPDGRIMVRDEVDQSQSRGEHFLLSELPAGVYYLEVRRRLSGAPGNAEATFRVASGPRPARTPEKQRKSAPGMRA